MFDLLTGLAVGLVFGSLGLILLRRIRRAKPSARQQPTIYSSIEQMRTVGDLSVFKVFTKEIVTQVSHDLGNFGKKYLKWILSSKKMAMIFSFEIDFRYNLRDGEFHITEDSPGAYRLRMPKCLYEIYIKDIQIYDEQRASFIPWLLPGMLHQIFGTGFDEEDKNRLIDEAKAHAANQARNLVLKMRSEVHQSARQTLEALAKAFGAQQTTFDFQEQDLVQLSVQYTSADEPAARGENAA